MNLFFLLSSQLHSQYIKVRFLFFLYFLCFFSLYLFFILFLNSFVLNNCMNVVVGFVFTYEINFVRFFFNFVL